LSIDKYIEGLEPLITSFSIVTAHTITIDRKTPEIVFISGIIEFRNGATLDFKEFLENKKHGLEKYMYAYNYRMQSDVLFRYDNSPDPRAKGLQSILAAARLLNLPL